MKWIGFKRDGDEYLLIHGNGAATPFRATEYGIRQLIADYGGKFEHRSRGWYIYRVTAWRWGSAVRRCANVDCGKVLPADARASRKWCDRLCGQRARRRKLAGL